VDKFYTVLVDGDTGVTAIVTAGGAVTVTGTFTETVVPILQANNGQILIAGNTQILAANAARKRFSLVNMDTTQTVFLMFGGGAATITKFPLFPRTYYDSDNGPFVAQEEIRGIEGAGAPTVGFVEWI